MDGSKGQGKHVSLKDWCHSLWFISCLMSHVLVLLPEDSCILAIHSHPSIFSYVDSTGNALVVIVVLCNPQMRSTTNLLIINLAVADLLFIGKKDKRTFLLRLLFLCFVSYCLNNSFESNALFFSHGLSSLLSCELASLCLELHARGSSLYKN